MGNQQFTPTVTHSRAAKSAASVTPSDTTDLPAPAARGLYIGVTGDVKVDMVGSGAGSSASGTLTSTNVNVSNNDTVTIGTKVYTYKTSLTPTEGEVLIGGSADASLLNLINAINHTGTPDTDYKCAAQNADVSAATSVTAHAFAITARASGTAGNSIATTETAVTLSFTGSLLTGGGSAVTFKAVPVGILAIQAKRVFATGTTATNIVALI